MNKLHVIKLCQSEPCHMYGYLCLLLYEATDCTPLCMSSYLSIHCSFVDCCFELSTHIRLNHVMSTKVNLLSPQPTALDCLFIFQSSFVLKGVGSVGGIIY